MRRKVLMNLGKKVQRLRIKGGRSIKALAETVGVTEGQIRQLEKQDIRSPRTKVSLAIARLFDVPLDWLADDTQGWPAPKNAEQKVLALIRSALVAEGLGRPSAAERRLLRAFHRLNEIDRAELLGRVEALAQGAVSYTEPTTEKSASSAAEAEVETQTQGSSQPGRRRKAGA